MRIEISLSVDVENLDRIDCVCYVILVALYYFDSIRDSKFKVIVDATQGRLKYALNSCTRAAHSYFLCCWPLAKMKPYLPTCS